MKNNTVKYTLIGISFLFLFIMLIVPLILVIKEAFGKGLSIYLATFTDTFAVDAIYLTLLAVLVSLVVNTIFGITSAWLITKFDFSGKPILMTLINLPFAISPVIVGIILLVTYSRGSFLYNLLSDYNIMIVFGVPAVIMATIFVTMPIIVQELIPLMTTQGRDEEEAASLLGASGWTIFRRITLPNIKWSLIYGVILASARAMGEFGAVSVVSGHIRGRTNTLPLHIELLYNEYNFTGAFAAATLLIAFAILILIVKNLVQWYSEKRDAHDI